MNKEDALQASEEALQELAEQLEQGHSESLTQYLNMISLFHHYSFGNCMLIAAQKPEATMVAGFGRWKKLKRFVKKGEKGIAILAPLISKKKESEESSDGADEESRLFGFRVVHVFDVSQTDGEELPDLGGFSGEPGTLLTDLEQVVRNQGIELVYELISGGALGMSQGGRITVLPELIAAETFHVLAHELAHELLHRGDRRQETTKTLRETEAEAVAYTVSRAIGLDCSTHAADYIQLYQGDNELLMKSLELIRTTASSILTDLEQVAAQSRESAAEPISMTA